MLTIESNHELRLHTVYTDVLGVYHTGSPKLLGILRQDFITGKWIIEPSRLRFPTYSRQWHVASRKNGFKSLIKLERKLLAAMQ